MVQHTNRTIESDHEGDDEERQRDNAKRLSPREAYGDDPSGKLPGRRVEGIRNPVGDEGCDAPFAVARGHGIKVFVCPTARSGLMLRKETRVLTIAHCLQQTSRLAARLSNEGA